MSIGFDNDPLNFQLLLSLPFREMVGAITHDRAKPSVGAAAVQELPHSCTLHGTPAWSRLPNGLPYLDFDLSHPDYLSCPAAATDDLDFTSEDFSLAVWAYFASWPANAMRIIGRATTDACGWVLYIWQGNLAFRTNQAGSRCGAGAPVGFFALDTWYFIGFTRSGLVGQFYADGVPILTTHAPVGGLLDPVACGVRNLDIGIYFDHIIDPYDGRMWNLRAWRRRLSAMDMAGIYAAESKWFN